VDRRQSLVSGALLAFLLTLSAPAAAQEPDCSQGAPPTGSIQVTGPQVRVGEHLFAGPGARIEVAATDAAGGPAQWTPMMDGREESAWPASWTAGDHTAGAAVVDACGRRSTLAPVAFTMDTEAPAIRWKAGDRQSFAGRLAPDSERDRRRRLRGRAEGRPAKDTWITVGGVLQTPLPWVDFPSDTFLARAVHPVQIKSDHPQVFLAAPATVAAVDGSDSSLGDRLLWIAAEDAGAGVESLTLRLTNEQNRAVLLVEAVDQVGNTSRKEIVLRRQAQASR
jgi:hypothetical protein